jgi:rod shape-determining protein MreC
MVLNAGRGNTVLPGQAVVDARGMIGRIYLAGARTSWVILLTDINSRIPVTIAPSSPKSANGQGNIQGMMTGDNSAMPSLQMVSRLVTLHEGDQVVSSGDGGLLPPGLAIGTVVADGHDGWRVALLADSASSQDVEVLNFAKPPEPLPPTAQLPAEAAGLKPAPPPPAPVQAPVTAPAPVMVKPKPKPEAVTPAGEDLDQ